MSPASFNVVIMEHELREYDQNNSFFDQVLMNAQVQES